jgi:hypothetical protein
MAAVDVATEVAFGDRPPPRQLRLINWRPLRKGALRGFTTIEISVGLTTHDVPVLVGRNGTWAALPGKPQIDKDGRQRTDANGRPAYTAVLQWRDGDLADRF